MKLQEKWLPDKRLKVSRNMTDVTDERVII